MQPVRTMLPKSQHIFDNIGTANTLNRVYYTHM